MKCLTLLVVVMCLASAAKAATPQNPLYSQSNANPIPLGNLLYYGSSKYYIESSTPAATPVQLFVGSGFYYGISCDSGSAGDLGLALDSASTAGLTINSTGKALGLRTLTSANGSTTCTGQAACGQSAPPSGPSRIHNGLVALKSGGGANNCVVYALSDAEILAGSH